MTKSTTPPWKKPAPKGKRHTKLTLEEKAQARARAAKAGRRYPNLVDNMAVAAERTKKRKSSLTSRLKG